MRGASGNGEATERAYGSVRDGFERRGGLEQEGVDKEGEGNDSGREKRASLGGCVIEGRRQ